VIKDTKKRILKKSSSKKKPQKFLRLSSGSQTRTDDLRVMSPTRYHFSIPQYIFGIYYLYWTAKVHLFIHLASESLTFSKLIYIRAFCYCY
jgi:hypothetical protein